MSRSHPRGLQLLIVISMVAALAPFGSSPAAAQSTECDGLSDAEIPAGAFIPSRFLADVDGDGHRDVVTGYELGGPRPNYYDQDAYLHVELASGWGTAFKLNSLDEYSTFPIAEPTQVVAIAERPLIVTALEVNANTRDFAFFEFHNCSMAAVESTEGRLPQFWAGGAFTHREWFSCRSDDVVMLDLERDLTDAGRAGGIIAGGEAIVYQLEPAGFRRTGTLDLDLPRSESDLHREFPDCSVFVGTFVDDNDSIFEAAIEWLAFEGLTKGCNPPAGDRYCPQDRLTRGQIAAFLVRALGYRDDGGGDLFSDDDGSVFEDSIDKLGAAGVTKGCNPPANDRFCPEAELTRGELAALMVRAFRLSDDGGGDLFTDDDGHLFESSIDRLGAARITSGCNPPVNDRFCPDSHVTRAQFAAFLQRALDGDLQELP